MSPIILRTVFFARILLFLPFMTVAGCVPVLMEAWQIGAAKVSSIVSGFYFAYAVSLLTFSFGIGWLVVFTPYLIAGLVILHSFFALGDSPVLSTTMAERVEPGALGAMLALRSVAGFTTGAISPVVFGLVVDTLRAANAGESIIWGAAFATLGLGGLLAILFAIRLPKRA